MNARCISVGLWVRLMHASFRPNFPAPALWTSLSGFTRSQRRCCNSSNWHTKYRSSSCLLFFRSSAPTSSATLWWKKSGGVSCATHPAVHLSSCCDRNPLTFFELPSDSRPEVHVASSVFPTFQPRAKIKLWWTAFLNSFQPYSA